MNIEQTTWAIVATTRYTIVYTLHYIIKNYTSKKFKKPLNYIIIKNKGKWLQLRVLYVNK